MQEEPQELSDDILLVKLFEFKEQFDRDPANRKKEEQDLLYEFLEKIQMEDFERLQDRATKLKAGVPVGFVKMSN